MSRLSHKQQLLIECQYFPQVLVTGLKISSNIFIHSEARAKLVEICLFDFCRAWEPVVCFFYCFLIGSWLIHSLSLRDWPTLVVT